MTDSASWQRIEAILDELLDLPPEARAARLDRLVASDDPLRPQIERFLAADAEAGGGVLDGGLARLADGVLDEPPPTAATGQRIGPYRVIRELGRGGMGEVLLAERADGDFEQLVALKLMRTGPQRAEIVDRFRRERRILARLRHPNIAVLHDGGATDDGVLYFAMEYVEGERITDWCDARRLTIDQRVELFESACRAVQHAHRNLVVHRDIKPSNVFVTADGVVKLLDFGIGKLLDPDPSGDAQATSAFLTPAFAAPEQILEQTTSTASDVFSLGMLLYVLLTGHHPYGDTSRSLEIARAIAEKDPPVPSTKVGHPTTTLAADEIAGRRGTDAGELRRRLRGDLDNIIGKALRKNPDERYASPEDLRADLERYRSSMPVHARPATLRYRLRKLVGRHQVATVAVVVTSLALIAGMAGILWQARIAAHERDRARAVRDYLLEVFSAADPAYETGASLSVLELVERGASRVSNRFLGDPDVRAEITGVLGTVLTNLADYQRADEVLTTALEEHRRLGNTEGVHETLLQLGESARWQGDFETALARNEEALRLARREFGEEDPRTLAALRASATVLLAAGRTEASGERYREALERARRVFGEGSEEIAPYHEGLAAYLIPAGDPRGAERELQAAVAAYRDAGASGLALSRALTNLGWAFEALDRRDESEATLRDAVAVLREEYGDHGHPELALALSNLAGPLMRSNLAESSGAERLAEADSLVGEACDILERTLGEDSWLLAQMCSNRSVVKTKRGDIVAAGELLTRAVRTIRTSLGDDHPELAAPLSNLARNFLRQKRYAEADSVYDEAITVARACFGDAHVRVSHPILGFAQLCLETGRLAEAEQAATEGWTIRREALGPTHSLVVEARVQVADALVAADRLDEAATTLDGAIAEAREGLPGTRAVLASALVERAACARAQDAPADSAVAWLEEALAIRRDVYGVDDDRTIEVHEALAGLEPQHTSAPR